MQQCGLNGIGEADVEGQEYQCSKQIARKLEQM